MKSTLTLLLFTVLYFTASATPTYQKLCEVNKCWQEQKDIDHSLLSQNITAGEREWIRIHLSLVEQTLRNRNTPGLTTSQQRNRLSCLDHLHQYWQAGNFPINEDYSYRTPIFIDKHNNFCAVGYLFKTSGHEAISRNIAAHTNTAYVREMDYPELNAWAVQYGFTTDELAWIQPSYGGGPVGWVEPVGKGTDGFVYELLPDNAGNKLYVGGKFTNVDSTLTANSIAYITGTPGSYTWHSMGTGVNGSVHAIALYNNNVFVAGEFDTAGGVPAANVAYWDGSAWHSAGCIYGNVKDLVVYKGELYAAGQFDVCAALMDVNFAKWTGTIWQQVYGLSGKVNTMEVVDTTLVLGGRFSYHGNQTNIIKYNGGFDFDTFNTALINEVKDLQVFKDTLYVVCKQTSANADLFQKLKATGWVAALPTSHFNSYDTLSLNTIAAYKDSMVVGGDFQQFISPGRIITNCMDVVFGYPYYNDINRLDSTVYTMAYFHDQLIVGGAFNISSPNTVNGIGWKRFHLYTSVEQVSKPDAISVLYPNPLNTSSAITVKNNFNATQFVLRDALGKHIASYLLSKDTEQLDLNNVSTGVYFAEISNTRGDRKIQQLVIQ